MSEDRNGMADDGEEVFGLDRVEAVLADLRAVALRPAAPEVADRHRALMEAAARAGSSGLVRGRAGAAAPFWTLHRRVAAALAAVAVGVFGLGGLGMAGALPGPVQDVVATVAESLGLDLPGSDPVPARLPTLPVGTEVGPSASGEAPGGVDETPGQSGSTPGRSGNTPAQGAEPPGLVDATPGQSGSTPGKSGSTPGQGASIGGPIGNPSTSAPGPVDNPGATTPTQVGENGVSGGGGGASATPPGRG